MYTERKISVGLGYGVLFAVLMGMTKFRFDVYLPDPLHIKMGQNIGSASLLNEDGAEDKST